MGNRELISKAQFAIIANVTTTAISKACKPGKGLHKATVGEGRKQRIDPNHPAALAYLDDRKQKGPKVTVSVNGGEELPYEDYVEQLEAGQKPAGAAGAKESRKRNSLYNIDPAEVPDNMLAFADMTIREAVNKFGTDYRMVDYLRALKEIETIEERRIKSAKMRGELVHRELITKGVLDPIDTAHRKMLTDGAKTIARRSVAMIKAGKDSDDLQKFIAEQISSFIKPAKAKIKRTLENVEGG
jgi:hypothetical protein